MTKTKPIRKKIGPATANNIANSADATPVTNAIVFPKNAPSPVTILQDHFAPPKAGKNRIQMRNPIPSSSAGPLSRFCCCGGVLGESGTAVSPFGSTAVFVESSFICAKCSIQPNAKLTGVKASSKLWIIHRLCDLLHSFFLRYQLLFEALTSDEINCVCLSAKRSLLAGCRCDKRASETDRGISDNKDMSPGRGMHSNVSLLPQLGDRFGIQLDAPSGRRTDETWEPVNVNERSTVSRSLLTKCDWRQTGTSARA